MPCVRRRNAYQHMSEFCWGRIAAYWNCGLSYCSSMGCQHDNHDFGYPWLCMTHRSTSNSVINNEPGCRSGITLSVFQTNPGSVYSIMMATSVFGGIVVNAHCKPAFGTVLQAHHLKLWRGLPVETHLDHLLFALHAIWMLAVTFLRCYGRWLCLSSRHP